MDKVYTSSSKKIRALARNERLRAAGATVSGAINNIVNTDEGGESVAITDPNSHTHVNKSHLDKLSTDSGYIMISGINAATDETETSKARAGHADTANRSQSADIANDLSENSPVWGKVLSSVNADTAQELITFLKGLVAKGESNFDSIIATGLARLAEVVAESVSSEVFMDGFGGNGFRIWKGGDGKWHATVDTLTVREGFNVFELIINKLRSVGGQIAVSAANGRIKKVDYFGNGDARQYRLRFEDGCPFLSHDCIRCQRWEYGASVKYYWVRISAVVMEEFWREDTGEGYAEMVAYVNANDFTEAGVPEAGDDVVLMGSENENRRSVILISASEDGQPRIDILDGIAPKWSGNTYTLSLEDCTKVRLGDLSGITDTLFGGALSGYGLYADNVYLKGKFMLVSNKSVEEAIGDVDAKIDNVKTELIAADGEISARVTEQGNTIAGHTTKIGELEVASDSISARVSTVENGVETNASSIELLEGEISLKVSADDVMSLVGNSGNLLRESWDSDFAVKDYGYRLSPRDSEYENLRGKTVTFSAILKGESLDAYLVGLDIRIGYADGTNKYPSIIISERDVFEKAVSQTFTIEDKEISIFYIQPLFRDASGETTQTSGTLYLSKPQLEYGTKATEWGYPIADGANRNLLVGTTSAFTDATNAGNSVSPMDYNTFEVGQWFTASAIFDLTDVKAEEVGFEMKITFADGKDAWPSVYGELTQPTSGRVFKSFSYKPDREITKIEFYTIFRNKPVVNEDDGTTTRPPVAGTLKVAQQKIEIGTAPTQWINANEDTEKALLDTGIDIKNKEITLTADKVVVRNNSGDTTAMFDENGMLNTNLIVSEGVITKQVYAIKNCVDSQGNAQRCVASTLNYGGNGMFCQHKYPIEDGDRVLETLADGTKIGYIICENGYDPNNGGSVSRGYDNNGTLQWFVSATTGMNTAPNAIMWRDIQLKQITSDVQAQVMNPQTTTYKKLINYPNNTELVGTVYNQAWARPELNTGIGGASGAYFIDGSLPNTVQDTAGRTMYRRTIFRYVKGKVEYMGFHSWYPNTIEIDPTKPASDDT